MVRLIMGSKGSGKTKQLIEMINNAAKDEPGNVVCIEANRNMTYDIHYHIRLIDAGAFGQLLLGHILFFPGCCDQRPGLCPIHTSSPGASISNPACSHNKRCVEPPRFRRGAVSFGRVFPPHGCSPPRCSRSTRITRFMPSVRYLLRWRTRK